MEHELTLGRKTDLVAVIDQQGIGEMLKPLTQEIFLFDTYVAGTSHLKDQTILQQIQVGDRLLLAREDNKFDEHAILVLSADKRKLGYVPEKDNLVFSRLMDAGKTLAARITDIEPGNGYAKIGIKIFMIDF